MQTRYLRFPKWKRILEVAILLCLFGVVLKSVNAETEEEGSDKNAKKNSFELILKRQTYQWTPYDYTSYTERSPLETSIKTDSVKQNQKVLTPFVFRFDQKERKFRVEISAYEIELANPNMIVTRTGSSGFEIGRQYLNPMIRSEAELNLFKIFDLHEDWRIFAGAGIRNINKYKYGYYLREGAYEEYFYTYGPQLVFRTDYRIWEKFFLSLGADLFYTEGNRFYKPKTFTLDSVSLSSGTAGVRGIYRGYEIDFSFAYQISQSLKFYLGYSYIDSYFSYYGFNQTDLRFGNASTDPFQIGTSNTQPNYNTFQISHPILSGHRDLLRGVYLGLSVQF
ncbi:hypothetical protein CH370_21655 [Leptospira kmetyi]|uniref:LA_2444/LA_4059 family outer membrane protein n=1 Tax=Leptospira kmetyi TaxID=408139 RepID=UPI0002F81D7C|nr:LA_2444/LA_4059 family outer membrane protein [Leptospira kmetyi]EQA51634.1 outer membrane protein, TIGR04327 family [Leptospira kmetyi serovar Malaysia str. Bejo-Iso9]PJZ39411.1 hypothetical protein CH370_21655 [Leptospira kmetyi]